MSEGERSTNLFSSFIRLPSTRISGLRTSKQRRRSRKHELVALIRNTGMARALVQDPSGSSYIIGEGTRIGKNDGRVIGIDDNLIIVKETYVDFLGQETTKDIEIRIRRSEGG